jgi:hypothetical protein
MHAPLKLLASQPHTTLWKQGLAAYWFSIGLINDRTLIKLDYNNWTKLKIKIHYTKLM